MLDGDDLSDEVREWIREVVETNVTNATEGEFAEDWDLAALVAQMQGLYGTDITVEELREEVELEREALIEEFVEDALETYDEKEKEYGPELMREIERYVMLQVVDSRWRSHLDSMDYLRDGIHLRAMAQKDPLVEYRAEGHAMFEELGGTIREEVVLTLFHAQIEVNEPAQPEPAAGERQPRSTSTRPPPAPTRSRRRAARPPRSERRSRRRPGAAPQPRHRGQRAQGRRPQRPVLVRQRQEVQEVPRRVGMSETAIPLDQQLEEIRAQLAWVRDYL